MTAPVILTEEETAILVGEARPDRVLELPWAATELVLLDTPGNQWALRRLRQIRRFPDAV